MRVDEAGGGPARRLPDAGDIVLGGASAGACLAAGTALRYQDDGGRLAGVLLAYGFFHLLHPAMVERHHRPRGYRRLTHSRRALDAMNRNYAGPTPGPQDRYAFPGGGGLQGFPQTLLLNAERDGMRPSADRFAAEFEAAGSRVERHLVSGSRHAFLNRHNGGQFKAGVDRMVNWLETIQHRPPNEQERSGGAR
jgi:acetyl esterase